jgi:hypothetical protein
MNNNRMENGISTLNNANPPEAQNNAKLKKEII